MRLIAPSYCALEQSFALESHRSLAPHLAESFADLLAGTPAAHRITVSRSLAGRWRVAWDGEAGYVGPSADLALYDALITINDQAAAQAATRCVVLHGGSVCVDGRAVAFVGHSGAGKTTLTAAATRAGCGYIADEVVAVDAEDMALPYHRPLGLRPATAALLNVEVPDGPFDRIYPLRVGRSWGSLHGTAPLAAVFLLDRRADAEPQCERLRPAEALYRLANETLGATGAETVMFRRLTAFVRRIPVVRLSYRDYDQALDLTTRFVRDAC